MTARTFTLIMIAFSLTGLTAVLYIAFVRGYVIRSLECILLVVGVLFEVGIDLICQACIDVSKPFRKKAKPVKLDDHENEISS